MVTLDKTQIDFYAGNGVRLSLTQDNKISGSATSVSSFRYQAFNIGGNNPLTLTLFC